MASKMDLLFLSIVSTFLTCLALPEQGRWDETLAIVKKQGEMLALTKSMYNGSSLNIRISCHTGDKVRITWLFRWTPCAEEYIGVETLQNRLDVYLDDPELDQVNMGYPKVHYIRRELPEIECSNLHLTLEEFHQWTDAPAKNIRHEQDSPKKSDQKSTERETEESPEGKTRKRRDAETPTNNTTEATATATKNIQKKPLKKASDKSPPVLTTTERDGIYLFILKIENITVVRVPFNVTVTMVGPRGDYLSAVEWPFLPFYASMCLIYVVYGLVWLILSMCNWKDLLRIQFWIGGVIFLGMLEKAVFFAEYESINKTGQSVRGAVVFAELVSCLKRTLARMLVVIVSIGFGIVKPRLGPAFHRVMGAGALYFILAAIEGCLRVLRPKGDNSNQSMLATIPLAVLDAAICWWVFTSLVQTTRTLRLRRNLVKLSLYRHFTNTLIFAVLASVAFMIWSIKQHKLATCLTDWKEIWVDEAFWHILFSVILLVIMILWRPTINNQRYAFSPLLDAADEEAEEPMMNDAFDGMKMRPGRDGEVTKKHRENKNKAEEDLKWIEDNIPASVADTALPSLLDSDEEVMTTRFEMSKMD